MPELADYEFLEEAALALGVSRAKVIPSDKVIVEDRVRLRCAIGCPSYGHNLKCPPFVPTPEEFRKVLKEYRFAMVVKFKPQKIPEEIQGLKLSDPEKVKEIKAKYRQRFHSAYKSGLDTMLELERAAFSHGYVFALAFYAGSCALCDECNVKKGSCLNPATARVAAEAVGVNVVKTAENAGMPVTFSMEVKAPEPMALLLID